MFPLFPLLLSNFHKFVILSPVEQSLAEQRWYPAQVLEIKKLLSNLLKTFPLQFLDTRWPTIPRHKIQNMIDTFLLQFLDTRWPTLPRQKMDAIKKKMQSLKTETENAMAR